MPKIQKKTKSSNVLKFSFTETLMLRNRSVELIFQPPYSPEFNSCEFCFRSMKAYLRQHEQFSINFTELAIIQGLQTITPAISQNIFSHCGFVI